MKYFKYIIGIALVLFIVSNAEIDQVLAVFKDANYLLIATNLPIFLLAMLANSYKWQILVKTIDFYTLLRSNIIATYYAIFMPGQVATESLKIYRLNGVNDNNIAHLSSSVFVDKLIGLMSLMFVGVLSIPFSAYFKELQTLMHAFLAVFILVLIVILNSTLPVKIFRFIFRQKFLQGFKFLKNFDSFLQNCHNSLENIIHGNYLLILKSFFCGVLFQLLNILGNYVVAVGINLDISFIDLIWIVALMSVALVLPITFAGIGVRELGFAGIFKILGLPIESAIALALASYGIMLYQSSAGYFVDLVWGVRVRE